MPNTLLLSHPDCLEHQMGPAHPESPARLYAIRSMVAATDWQGQLEQAEAPLLARERLLRAHPERHVAAIEDQIPHGGLVPIDADTSVNSHSLSAALRAAGAGCLAVEAVMEGRHRNAFCAVRPPGHHAEADLAMGFCLFNSVALAAQHARALGAERVAIIDFDVHHGNGTVQIFQDQPEVLVCSSFQFPFYPGRYDRVESPNIVLSALDAGTDGAAFRDAVGQRWTRAIDNHRPDILLVSAGFDAHRLDPLGGLNWHESDFRWATNLIKDLADRHCGGRVVSMLEGGYDLAALAASVREHLFALTGIGHGD